MTVPVLASSSNLGAASSTAVTTRNVTTPTGTAVGDVLVAIAVWRSTTADISVAWTGGGTWTRLGQTVQSTTMTTARFVCPVDSAPASSITFTSTTSAIAMVWVGRVTGALAAATDVLGSWGTLDATVDAPAVTTTAPDDLLLFTAVSASPTASPWTPPAGMTEDADLFTPGGGSGVALEVAWEGRPTPGDTGTRTATQGAAVNGNAALWAIKSATAGTILNPPALTVPITMTAPVIDYVPAALTVSPPALTVPIALTPPAIEVTTDATAPTLVVPVTMTAPVITYSVVLDINPPPLTVPITLTDPVIDLPAPPPPRNVDFLRFDGRVMRLDRFETEFYEPKPVTEPPLTAWQASFDNGATWVDPQIVDGEPVWLVTYGGSTTGATVITRTNVLPKLRDADNPETLVENGPRIIVT